MFKSLFALFAFCLAALSYALTHAKLEDDPVRSLGLQTSRQSEIFKAFHENSLFSKKIFIDFAKLEESEKLKIEDAARDAGYEPHDQSLAAKNSIDLIHNLLLLIPPSELMHAISHDMIEKRAEDLLGVATFPGGEQFLQAAQADPFGLNETLAKKVLPHIPPPIGGELKIYQSPSHLSYERVGKLYDTLVTFQDRVQFIGSDFFSLENYRSIKRDVSLCATLAIILNIFLFVHFTRRLNLAICLFFGSIVSYVFGFFAVVLFHEKIYMISLAFTSTLVSFNNEAIVHLSGLGKKTDLPPQANTNSEKIRMNRIRGVWSAMGTTLLGFLVLLLGDSVIVKQMAIAAIGGTLGFLIFLYCVRNTISHVTFEPFTGMTLQIKRLFLSILVLGGTILIFLRPDIQTKIEDFRFQSTVLANQIEHFNERLNHARLGQFVAVDLEHFGSGDNLKAKLMLAREKFTQLGTHPLDLYQSIELQNMAREIFVTKFPLAAEELKKALEAKGLRIKIQTDFSGYSKLHSRSEVEFLDWVQQISPMKWYSKIHQNFVLFMPATHEQPVIDASAVSSLSPSAYYNRILSDLSSDLAHLFVLSLCAMGLYLAYVQRNLWKVLYILAPVVISAGGFALYSVVSGQALNIIHFMGFALTIALAIDYTSVTVSTKHHAEDRAKVLLTGCGSLASFGVLLFAEHPVLRTLGTTVTFGCAIGLVFALFLRINPKAEDQETP